MFIFSDKYRLLRRILLLLLTLCLLFPAAGCADKEESGEAGTMNTAAKELIDVLWNVDYNTFTPEKATAYAKKYYESEFLKEFMDDINYNSGIPAIKEEKLISKVVSMGDGEASKEELGDTTYKKYTMTAKIEIKSYEPMYPEDSFLEAGKTYDLLFTLYFAEQDGALKLVAYAYEPENGVFLPKRANNVQLNADQRNEIKIIAENYCKTRYNFDYRTYAPKKIFEFFKMNATDAFMENEGLTEQYIGDFYKDIKTFKMRSVIVSLKILAVEENKAPVNMPDGTQFFYFAVADIRYVIDATDDFFKQAQMKKGELYAIKEYLGFDLLNGKFKIAFTEWE